MAVQIVIPTVGESVTHGVIARWVKKNGEAVRRDETVLELETDKVTMEVPAPAAGVVRHSAKEGDTVAVGQSVGEVDESASAPAPAAAPVQAVKAAEPVAAAAAAPVAAAAHAGNGEVRATPLARKVAEELGVDLAKVHPTGPSERIRQADVVNFVQTKPAPAPAAASVAVAGPRPGVTREKMTTLRQRIASRLVEAQHTAAMLTTFNEVDMTAVMALRAKYKDEFEKKHGIGLGFMSFFVKAAASALRAFPLVNAYIVDDGGQPAIQKHDFCDIAVAVSTPKGLVVPVLRGCEKLSMAGVEKGIKDLAIRARDGKLSLDEMQGGTFTITNGGIYGSLMSTPILNPPQSGILGMHAIKNRAVEDPNNPGQVAIRPMMYLALSYDHRIIDGAEAVQFLVKIKQAIEDPSRLLLEM
ncbi:MAG: 2-oxoglutarate dehydrogenase complex dihydrolipoyllysine-residue succinyltransferase [Planctomycetota bacterium]|nr:2-oxoglutarate dehydrogenase complex dihydrolipoyllysine-residue succinyltransferase [Planctomycetota bacterium]